jgi:CO/xanthine dehydrogenase Mo-binding subunit
VYQDEWIKQTAGLIAEIIKDKYDAGRWVRIIGEDDKLGIQQITQDLKNTKFDVDILPSLTMPFDKEKRQAAYMAANQIVTQPVASPMTDILLKELDIPGWQKILKRYGSWQQFLAYQQLIEAVKSGETDPRSALKLLIKKFEEEVMPAIEQRVNEQGFQQKVNQGNKPGEAG